MQNAKDKLEWVEFDLLKNYPEVTHGSFLKHGGVSHEHFASLNLSPAVGDHADHVKVNQERVLEALGLTELALPNQEHGKKIIEITAANAGTTHACDGLITQEKNVGIGVLHADCQAALFFDPTLQMIGCAHAGYKGSVQNIYAAIVEKMKEKGSDPKDILVCISPSLGPCHAEFKHYKKELPESFWDYQPKENHFDFWEISKMQLNGAGIDEKNIEIAGLCTFCEKQDHFSHRREKKTGRHATIIGLK